MWLHIVFICEHLVTILTMKFVFALVWLQNSFRDQLKLIYIYLIPIPILKVLKGQDKVKWQLMNIGIIRYKINFDP